MCSIWPVWPLSQSIEVLQSISTLYWNLALSLQISSVSWNSIQFSKQSHCVSRKEMVVPRMGGRKQQQKRGLHAVQSNSVQFSRSVMSDSLQPHESQHARPPCPSPTPGIYSNSCPLSQWCHPAISSSVIPFSSCPQSLPASGSFPTSQLFTWGGQSTGVSVSASALPMNTQDWAPLAWTGWISLQSKGLSRVFSNTTVQKQ